MRLFEFVCKRMHDPTPAPSKAMIIAEMVLTFSRTTLFEIVWKRTGDPLQTH
jgi:hypothetical protein